HEGAHNAINSVEINVPGRLSGTDVYIQNTNGETLIDLGAQTWEVRVRFQDGSAEAGEVRQIAAAFVIQDTPGEHWLCFTVTSNFSQAPKPWDIVAFGPTNKSSKPWRCVAISRSAVGFRHITG